jgi:hypothetical protein
VSATVHTLDDDAISGFGSRSRQADGSVLLWHLADERLPDGDYRLIVSVDDASVGRPEVVRLRSADRPAVLIDDDRTPLGHTPREPRFGLFPCRINTQETFRGVPSDSNQADGLQDAATSVPGWYAARLQRPSAAAPSAALHVPAPADSSCMVTGAHLMQIETVIGGESSVEGVCRTCGLVKRFPTRGRAKRRSRSAATRQAAPAFDVSQVPPVAPPVSVDWPLGFDALCHLGRGPSSALERIAIQIEPTGLFGDVFARRLEALGHLEIERDPNSLAAISWEIVDPLLIGIGGGRTVVTGFRSARMMAAVHAVAVSVAAEIVIDDVDAVPRVRISAPDDHALGVILDAISTATNRPATFVADGAGTLAAALPPLSEAIAALPATGTTSARTVERWNCGTARFEPAGDTSAPGAYRLSGFGRAYVYRRPADLGSMTALLGDARVVKFAAALEARATLIGYDQSARVLYTPLGAELPGLYGRAAVLASGRPPFENLHERLLEYHAVSPQLAGMLQERLMT